MSGVKISALPPAASAALTDIFPAVQSGVTYQETLLQVSALFGFDSSSHLLSLASGGTNANLTAANGAVPYSTASAFALLAPGSSGQMFQSGGAGAPAWTTATYPATASTSGKVIVSDGTNFSSSFSTGITGLGTQAQALNMGTHQINNVTDPTSAQDAATKNYVDTIAQGITVQGACYAGTTANLTATYVNGVAGVGATLTNSGALAAFSVDGVSPALNARILVKNQSTSAENGIYVLSTVGSGAVAWILTRSTDYDQASEINPGDLVVLTAGSTQASSSWLETATVTTVGTDAISFSQFTASLPVSVAAGGTGLTTTTAYSLIAAGTTTTGAMQMVGTGSSGQILRSGGNAALPAWSTATFPATTTINQLLYSSANNTIAGLSTANSSGLLTNGSGVPSWVTVTGTGAPVLANTPTLITPVLGAATGTSLNFGASATNGLIGVTGASSAASGVVGEVISSTVLFSGSPVSLTSGTPADVTSISLTAGDWDVWGNVTFSPAGGSLALSGASCWISTTSATKPDDALRNLINFGSNISLGVGINAPTVRINVSSPTTVYLSCQSGFSATTNTACGSIFARRRR